ncbi:uncharacterized protein METZ01_LOCUS374684, partial [marine metagenome]
VSGTYSVTAGGVVSDSGDLDIEGATTILASGSNVVLDRATHDFTGAVGVTGAAVELVDANGIVLGDSTVSGAYQVTATAGGDITDAGVLDIDGAATFTAANGRSITLDSSNTFSGTVAFSSGGTLTNVEVKDTTAFVLAETANLTLSGNLTVTTGGALTDTNVITVPGTTTITATGQVVDLDHTSNNFATILFGSSSNAVASVEVVDTNAIAIGASKSTGNFTVTAGDDVTDSGTVTVGGNLSVTTSASDGLINMGTLEVDGTIALTTNGDGAATVVNDAEIDFAASTVGGALSATATTGN